LDRTRSSLDTPCIVLLGTRCPSCSSASIRLAPPERRELLTYKCNACGRMWSEHSNAERPTTDPGDPSSQNVVRDQLVPPVSSQS